MNIYCANREHKCGYSEHVVKVNGEDSLDAICLNCGNVNSNVTEFAKISMKQLNQVWKEPKIKENFVFKCETCNVDRKAMIIDDNVSCLHCRKPFRNISFLVKQNMINLKYDKSRAKEAEEIDRLKAKKEVQIPITVEEPVKPSKKIKNE